MAEDDRIGSPHEHDPNKFVEHHVGRPNAGYIEERLKKLEFYQRDLRVDNVNVKQLMVDTSSDNIWYAACKACGNSALENHSGDMAFPLCNDCMHNIGMMTKAKESWCFKE